MRRNRSERGEREHVGVERSDCFGDGVGLLEVRGKEWERMG